MKKNFATAVALTIALSITVPASAAFTRDAGGGRDREFSPIERVIKMIKKLFKPATEDEMQVPHP
jgi:hypothetical protein